MTAKRSSSNGISNGIIGNPDHLDRLTESIAASLGADANAMDDASVDTSEDILSAISANAPALTAAPPPPPPPAPSSVPVTASTSVTALAIPSDISTFLSALTPEQLTRVRSLAAAQGISAGPRKGPNGGLLIEVEIPETVVEPFAAWAESAGEPLTDFIRKIAADSLIAYCYQDWGQAPSSTGPSVKPADTMKPAAAAASATTA